MPRPNASERRILDGARCAIDRYGWQRMTAERIAEQAVVSRVTLHRHGLTKETILARLAEEAARPLPRGDLAGADWGRAGDKRLARALETLCGLAEENLGLLIALDARADAAVFHEDRDEEALSRDVFTVATVLFNLVGWTYIHLRSGHRWKPKRAREATLDLALNGLLTTGAFRRRRGTGTREG